MRVHLESEYIDEDGKIEAKTFDEYLDLVSLKLGEVTTINMSTEQAEQIANKLIDAVAVTKARAQLAEKKAASGGTETAERLAATR